MRGHGPPPWRWRDQPPYFAGRRMPRRFVRRMGCAFAALITLAAVGASTLVSLLWRSPQQVGRISAVAVALAVALVSVFRLVIRRGSRAFGEQDRPPRPLMGAVPPQPRAPPALPQGP